MTGLVSLATPDESSRDHCLPLALQSGWLHTGVLADMSICVRTSIDIPDALLEQVRARLRAQGRTLREAVIEGLRRTVLVDDSAAEFELRDASFRGKVGFAEGFEEADLADAIRGDGEARMVAEEQRRYRK